MGVLSENALLGASGAGSTGYVIEKSLIFDSGDGAELSWTPAASNRKTWSCSFWMKKSQAFSTENLFAQGSSGTNYSNATMDSSGHFLFTDYYGGTQMGFKSLGEYNDVGAWYHVLYAFDTSQATESNRMKLYVNGVQQEFESQTWPSHNYDSQHMNTTSTFKVCSRAGSPDRFNGYLADFYFIDGTQCAVGDFGELDDYGVWQPIKYEGSYGTNGFFLNWSNSSALGEDQGTEGNDLSVTSLGSGDLTCDSPTTGTEPGAHTGGNWPTNYCIMNALAKEDNNVWTQGGLRVKGDKQRGTFAMDSGKWYYEAKCIALGSGGDIGWEDYLSYPFNGGDPGSHSRGWSWHTNPSGAVGGRRTNGSYNAWTNGHIAVDDILMTAINIDTGSIWWGKNGTWYGSDGGSAATGNPATNAYPVYTNADASIYSGTKIGPACGNGGGSDIEWEFNFGQKTFSYTPPSGFKPINAANLPDFSSGDSLNQPNKFFDVTGWTGNSNTHTITLPGGFSPDLVVIKGYSTSTSNIANDTIHGANKGYFTNDASTGYNYSNHLDVFNSDGFTLGAGGSSNSNGATYVAYCWDAGSSTTTTAADSLGSGDEPTVSCDWRSNSVSGVGLCKFDGDTSQTNAAGKRALYHNVGSTPHSIFSKRVSGSSSDWGVFHWWADETKNGQKGAEKYLECNNTDTAVDDASWWADMAPTSTLWYTGDSYSTHSGDDHTNWIFAPIPGFSAFGYHVGRGNDTIFCYTGFKPRWLMIKSIDKSNSNWIVYNTYSQPVNGSAKYTFFNEHAEEGTAAGNKLNFCSNGFHVPGTNDDSNYSGNKYVWWAFADQPFKITRGF